ncbi:MAG: InlB B-repeat-containing protein, partial [Lachnospiraceae bacterium]|nr:InlB B-repeat-containing protein [Lachnospiraceae bacterium]
YEDADFQTKVEKIEKGSTGNRILYAKWIPHKFTISYVLDGGENNARNPEEYTIETNTFQLENPTKKGYDFEGWYTEPEYETLITEIENGSIGSYTIYAKWTLRKYTITYELDGGENSDLNPTEYTIETDSVRLKAPTKYEYKFGGWYTDSDFDTSITEIEKGRTENLTLYAKWIPNLYTIVYELDGGENSSLNPTEYTIETDDFYLEAPTKKYYDFEGWYIDSDFETGLTEIEKGSTGDQILYAKWTPTRYPIRYELDKGTNSLENPTEYNVETADIVLVDPVKEQYIFDGWYADSDYQEKIDTIKTGSSGAVILYAKWSLPKRYHVRFFDDAGNLLAELEAEEGDSVLAPQPEERTGYEFVQWDRDYTNVQDDLDIRAIYHPIQYTITYELDGAANAPENPATYTIETDDFDFAAPVHPDMNLVFAGWYCDNDFQDEITSIIKGSIGDITIYAKWEKRRIDRGNGLFLEIKDFADRIYTGQAITFDEIVVYNHTNVLRPGIDYTISYANNINAADASSNHAPTVIVTGAGNYTGKCMSQFTIQPVDIGAGESAGDIVIEKMAVSYKKGKTQKPIPVVIWKGQKLAVNKDFTVSYQGLPSNVGVYPITITGKGNFTGTAQTSLTITDNTNQIAMSTVKITKKIPTQEYSPSQIVIDENMITLKYGSTQLIAGRDYEFDQHEYQGAGTHYVKIRGIGDYYIGEITSSFEVSGTKASQFIVDSVVCTGKAVKPVIKDKTGRQLTEGTDYVINSLTGSEAAGTAKINITGINAYYGTVTKSFKVTPRSINDSDITIQFANGEEIQPYEKNGAKPKVSVEYDGHILTEGVDYSLSYKNNNKIGAVATVTISGKKNFKEKAVRSFTVGAGSLENTSITIPDKVVSTKEGGYVSVPVLKDANGKKLTAGKDYDKNIIYKLDGQELNKKADRVPAGTEITVEVIGKGNYAGSQKSGSYRIIVADKNLSKAKVTVNSRKYYTGSKVELKQEDLTVKVRGVTLSADDYEILADSYINNHKKGTAKVTIHGIDKYGGTKTVSFKIYAKKLE